MVEFLIVRPDSHPRRRGGRAMWAAGASTHVPLDVVNPVRPLRHLRFEQRKAWLYPFRLGLAYWIRPPPEGIGC